MRAWRASEPRAATTIRIRPRTDDDIDELVALARRVHAQDGYPPHLPSGDFRAFLAGHVALGAWVATTTGDGRIAGHVALHPHTAPSVMRVAAGALGCATGDLAVVARLLVGVEQRGMGAGRALLDHATGEARARGKRPVLDTAEHLHAAIRLYESAGWTRVGQAQIDFRDGTTLTSFVYVPEQPCG